MTPQKNGLTDKNILKHKKTQHVGIFNHFNGSNKWSQYLLDGIIQMLLYVILWVVQMDFIPEIITMLLKVGIEGGRA